MKAVIFLYLTVIACKVRTKAVEFSNSCNESPETDPRLKRSEEIEDVSFITEVTESSDITLENQNTNESDNITKINKYDAKEDIPISVHKAKNREKDSNDYTLDNLYYNHSPSNLNGPLNLPVIVTKNTIIPIPDNRGSHVTPNLNRKPIQETTYYPIDPKYIITSKPYKPWNPIQPNHKNNTKAVTVNETITVSNNSKLEVENSNLTEPINSTLSRRNGDLTNDTNSNEEELNKSDENDDSIGVSNIRELREQLLDHLLDYFINIIQDELGHNNTRKNNGNEMKVEDRLRNYYDPHHLDLFLLDDEDSDADVDDLHNDSDENDTELDKNTEGNLDNNAVNNTLRKNISLLLGQFGNNSENFNINEELNLKANNTEINSNIEYSNGNLAHTASSDPSYFYINNDTDDALLSTEKNENVTTLSIDYTEASFKPDNIEMTTTEVVETTDNIESTTLSIDLLEYFDETIDPLEYIEDESEKVVNDDFYIESDSEEVIPTKETEKRRSTTVENINNSFITTENGRRNDLSTENGVVNDDFQKKIGLNDHDNSINKTADLNEAIQFNFSANIYLTNENSTVNCNETILVNNKNENTDIKEIKSKNINKKMSCLKDIILNLNINLIE